ncbi:hypothetical protein HPB49_008064 [Dermacentor silvarum]|uniref:Uncharacterized protein n=1 Tax=Dermacentor silvarum TaxID=543639 RepID=A0ACB8CDY6_DERSI|nr:hypothetical protein HPB49_008064 [Dermacentor silvarum]
MVRARADPELRARDAEFKRQCREADTDVRARDAETHQQRREAAALLEHLHGMEGAIRYGPASFASSDSTGSLGERYGECITRKGTKIGMGGARNRFSKAAHTRRWAFLQIETNERAKDEVQAYAAGALEAYLTRQLIENHWTNMFGGYCDSQPEYCRDLEQFFAENNKYSQQQQHLRRHNESFWNMVYLQMKQLAGLSDELENKTLDFSNEVSDVPRAQYLNALGDIQDLEHVLGREEDLYSIDQILACSALVKVVGDSEGLYFGHDAWFLYRGMLRFQKHYIFPWHLTALQKEPGDEMAQGYNDYKNDPLSQCNCTPPYNPVYAIAARTDLLDANGQYDVPGMNRRAVGGIDAKVTSHELFPSLEFVGESGPTWNTQPPFQWSTSGLAGSHVGQPDKWKFKPVHHKWKPARRTSASS